MYNIKTRWQSFFVVKSVFWKIAIIFRRFHSLLPNGQLRKGRQHQVYNDRNESPPVMENQGELESAVVTIIFTSVKFHGFTYKTRNVQIHYPDLYVPGFYEPYGLGMRKYFEFQT